MLCWRVVGHVGGDPEEVSRWVCGWWMKAWYGPVRSVRACVGLYLNRRVHGHVPRCLPMASAGGSGGCSLEVQQAQGGRVCGGFERAWDARGNEEYLESILMVYKQWETGPPSYPLTPSVTICRQGPSGQDKRWNRFICTDFIMTQYYSLVQTSIVMYL